MIHIAHGCYSCSTMQIIQTRTASKHDLLRRDYHFFLFTIALLMIIGLVFVYSASSVFALEKFGTPYYFLKKQIVGLSIGIAGLFTLQWCTPSLIKKLSPVAFLLSIIASALTLLPSFSHHIHGSSRWLSIAGFSLQPSELLKMVFIIYCAHVLSKKKYKYSFIRGFLPVLVIVLLIPSIILLLEPDFGLTVTLFLTLLMMLFLANFHIRHILITIFSLMPLAFLLIITKPYRMQRIATFLNPWRDPKGSGFQIIQSLIAIGSGGFLGVGIAQSKQKFFYLPMQHTDFIFSIIAEETGFIGVVTIISLYSALLYYGIKIAQQLADPFSRLVILGFVVLINLQAVINIAVTVGLVPTKGIGLPFISYGNTALVCNLWMIGIIMVLVRSELKHSVC